MILIVEDDLGIQETLYDLLTMKDYEVKQAYTIKEALNIDIHDIELIIMDIQLPDGNGVTLCQQIRQVSQVPILFLTARTDEETLVEALNAGGDDYILSLIHILIKKQLGLQLFSLIYRDKFLFFNLWCRTNRNINL